MWCAAVSCDAALADLMTGNVSAEVMGVYEKSFHLLLADERLVTVFGSVPWLMPMSIRTNANMERPFRDIPLSHGQRAWFSNGVLTVPEAGFLCTLGEMEPVSMLRHPLPLPKEPDALEEALLRPGKRRGAGVWLPQWIRFLKTGADLPEDAVLLHRFAELLESLSRGQEAVTESLMALVGMGIGLTPSADDMICGLCAAVKLWQPSRAAEDFPQILEGFCKALGRTRTTRISCQQLALTAEGILSDPVYDLAMALSGEKRTLDRSLGLVLEYGSSSGTEFCMGLLSGLYLAGSRSGNERNAKW